MGKASVAHFHLLLQLAVMQHRSRKDTSKLSLQRKQPRKGSVKGWE